MTWSGGTVLQESYLESVHLARAWPDNIWSLLNPSHRQRLDVLRKNYSSILVGDINPGRRWRPSLPELQCFSSDLGVVLGRDDSVVCWSVGNLGDTFPEVLVASVDIGESVFLRTVVHLLLDDLLLWVVGEELASTLNVHKPDTSRRGDEPLRQLDDEQGSEEEGSHWRLFWWDSGPGGWQTWGEKGLSGQ